MSRNFSSLATLSMSLSEPFTLKTLFYFTYYRLPLSIPEVHVSRRHSTDTDYKYNPLPMLAIPPKGLTASFPARRPSMCIITDQLLQHHRAAKIPSHEAVVEMAESDDDSQLVEEIDSAENYF